MGTYSVTQVADRIESVLGQRPTDNAILLGAGRQRPARGGSRSLVAEIPASLHHDGPRAWRAEDIEAWLAEHPILRLQNARQRFQDAYRAGLESNVWLEHAQAVWTAQDAGMSWAQIAEAIGEVTGRPIARQSVAKRYNRARQPDQATPAT